MSDPSAAVMAVSFFGMIAITVNSIAKVWMKRVDARREASIGGGEVAERLARIEAAVDVIALEVERIAEAQRFALKLSEGQSQARLGKGEGRVITPH